MELILKDDASIISLFHSNRDEYLGRSRVCQRLLEIQSLCGSQKMIQQLQQLGLKRPVVNTRPLTSLSCSSTATHESYWRVPQHQDWPSTFGSLNGVTVWMPLVETKDVGSLQMLPGSHKLGALKHVSDGHVPVVNDDFKGFKSIDMVPGDALFFSYFTIHRSGVNPHKDRIRWSLHMRFDDALEPDFVRRNYPQCKTESRVECTYWPTDCFH